MNNILKKIYGGLNKEDVKVTIRRIEDTGKYLLEPLLYLYMRCFLCENGVQLIETHNLPVRMEVTNEDNTKKEYIDTEIDILAYFPYVRKMLILDSKASIKDLKKYEIERHCKFINYIYSKGNFNIYLVYYLGR